MSALPFLPFTRPAIDEATIAAVAEVLRSGWITTGPKCLALEAALSARFGGRPVRLVNSGTATLELALRLCGVGPGDEVITTPLSWVATANVVLAVGATPVFVDVDARTRNIDLDRVEAAITPRTARDHAGRPGRPAGRSRPALRDRRQAQACAWSKTRRSPSVPAGAGRRSAASATWCRSASTPTRTSPPPKAAAWC